MNKTGMTVTVSTNDSDKQKFNGATGKVVESTKHRSGVDNYLVVFPDGSSVKIGNDEILR